MTSLSDAERDACDVMQALVGMAALLRRRASEVPDPDLRDPDLLGPDLPGLDARGPDSRGPDSRGPDSRGPDSRGPDLRGLDSRGPDLSGGPDLPGPDWPGLARPGPDPSDPAADQARRLLLGIAEDAAQACERVVTYLREQRGAGDGDLAAVPRRLGPWREWTPERGHLFGASAGVRRPNGVPQPRRSDPGE